MKRISNPTAFLIIIVFQQFQVLAQIQTIDYMARLKNDTLTLENSKIARTYKWNMGNIITLSLTNKENGKVWLMSTNRPDLSFPGQTDKATNAVFSAKIIPGTVIYPEHLEAEIIYLLDKLEVKRVFRLYRDCPVIACDLYFRGESNSFWLQAGTNLADMVNLEKLTANNTGNSTPVIEKIELPGKHWKIEAIEFHDVTDRFNNLVQSMTALSYRSNIYRGNLLFARDKVSGDGIFILKECPVSNVQLAYPGGDFITEYGTFKAIGVGINPSDLDPIEWRRGYGFVTGVYSGEEINQLTVLREYQKNIRIHKSGRDEMILMNTWVDR
jgi:hypothetical protein